MLEEIRTQADQLAEHPLEQLLDIADNLEVKLEKENQEMERLEKRLRMIKQELREYKEASKKEGVKFEESPLYEDIVSFIDSVESLLENAKINRGEYIAFLLALKKKLEEKKKLKKEMGRFKEE